MLPCDSFEVEGLNTGYEASEGLPPSTASTPVLQMRHLASCELLGNKPSGSFYRSNVIVG